MSSELLHDQGRTNITKEILINAITGGTLGAVAALLDKIYILPFTGIGLLLRNMPMDSVVTFTIVGTLVGIAVGVIAKFGNLEGRVERGSSNLGATNASQETEGNAGDPMFLKTLEEKLEISKKWIQTGVVSIHREILTDEKNISVPVRREELVIRRKPLDKVGTENTETIRIPIREENIEIRKYPAVLEHVKIYKRQFKEIEHVEEQLRKEIVKVDITGEVKVIDKKSEKRE